MCICVLNKQTKNETLDLITIKDKEKRKKKINQTGQANGMKQNSHLISTKWLLNIVGLVTHSFTSAIFKILSLRF